jgi:hypothetical protein
LLFTSCCAVPVDNAPTESLNPVEVSQCGDHVETRHLHFGSARLTDTAWVGLKCCAVAQEDSNLGFRLIWITKS